jgi:hypothetical protein
MAVAFMSFGPGTGVVGVTGVRFSCAQGDGETRADMGAAAMR